MRCPTCDAPVRRFLVDDEPVLVDQHPHVGTIDRVDVFGGARESDPHPGGYVRHQCKGAA